jgi:hypothetical protein
MPSHAIGPERIVAGVCGFGGGRYRVYVTPLSVRLWPFGASSFLVAANDAEVVARRVGQHHPPSAVGLAAVRDWVRAEINNALDLVIPAPVGRNEIEVDSARNVLEIIDLDEQQPMALRGIDDDALVVAGFVRIVEEIGVSEHLFPPLRERVGVGAVERGSRDT